MNQNKNQGGKRAVISFVVSILMAVVCFGVFVFVYMSTKGPTPVDDRIVEISKIIVFIGVFFLVMAFGHSLPMIIRGKKSQGGPVTRNIGI